MLEFLEEGCGTMSKHLSIMQPLRLETMNQHDCSFSMQLTINGLFGIPKAFPGLFNLRRFSLDAQTIVSHRIYKAGVKKTKVGPLIYNGDLKLANGRY